MCRSQKAELNLMSARTDQSKQKETGTSWVSVCELNWKGIWGLKHNFYATDFTHNIIRWALVLESVTRFEQWAPTMRFPPSCQCVCVCVCVCVYTSLSNKMPHCEGSTETLLLAALWVGGRQRRDRWREGEMERDKWIEMSREQNAGWKLQEIK